MKAYATYRIERPESYGFDDDEFDVSCFNPTINFVNAKQPDFPLSNRLWDSLGKPEYIRVTVEAADEPKERGA